MEKMTDLELDCCTQFSKFCTNKDFSFYTMVEFVVFTETIKDFKSWLHDLLLIYLIGEKKNIIYIV